MAKLSFPVASAPYRGFIGEIRGWFNRIASFLEKSPGSATTINAHLQTLATKTGFVQTQPATKQLISNGQAVTGVTLTGTAGAGKTATFTVAGGVITAATFT